MTRRRPSRTSLSFLLSRSLFKAIGGIGLAGPLLAKLASRAASRVRSRAVRYC